MQDSMRWQQGLLSLAAAGLMTAATTAGAADNPNGKGKGVSRAYIVQMADAPVTAYTGGLAGYAATKPGKGQKIDPNAPAVVRYKTFLAGKQDAALRAVGGGNKLYNYGYVFNGFAAELTEAQAQKLAQMPGVLAVTKDEIRKMDTASTPSFLGLTGPAGFWATKAKGENVVIGIVDSGIWPEHPSFSDRTGSNGNGTQGGKLDYRQIPGWNGKCTPGEAFNASHCNQKLIGAQYFNAGFGGNAGIKAQFPYEFNSARDADGHGSHTASTAGGNANVPATGPAAVFGSINGIAPRARIAAYKVCWGNNGEGGCAGVDSVAAIDQAVADGVDVINFSISGTSTNFRDPVEIAFLFAADAGVFVAASAGNSGPTTSTVAHPSPWITTVAAGTHNRDGQGSVTLGNGAAYAGSSFAAALGPLPLVDSANAVKSGAAAGDAELCVPGTLDPAVVTGKIVLCKRGAIALVDKTSAVAEAGGAGAVIYNDPAGATNTLALFHAVPTVHVVAASGLAIKSYIASASGPTGSISLSTVVNNAPAPFTASFSSRGPLRAGNGDLLKPDVIAPGQDIVAAVSPIGYNGRTFDLLSGTSMSSPHVAGLAALMKELKPGWSPMAIKSALMTTAGDVLDGPNTDPLVIFRQGAGHVRPMAAVDPGLVFDSNFGDWLSFICGVQPGGGCTGVTPMDPSNLNVPSIAIGDLAGAQTVKRRVTNVSGNPATFTASYTGLAGFTVTLPGPIMLAAGETREVSFTFTRTTAALNAYTGGQLTLSDGLRNVRVPVVLRPVALAAPVQVSGSYAVTFGYTGPFTATARGLVTPTVTSGTVAQDPDQTFDPADPAGTVAIQVVIPAGTTYARFALFDADVAPGADIDLYVYQGATLVGSSGGGSSAEEVNFTFANPSAGPIALTVYVHGWGLPGGTSPFKLHQWYLGTTAVGNMTVTAPASATLGQTGTINVSTSGLASGTRYLGSVAYGGAAGMPSPTIVRIDTP